MFKWLNFKFIYQRFKKYVIIVLQVAQYHTICKLNIKVAEVDSY